MVDEMESWVLAHERMVDLTTVWFLAACLLLIGVVDIVSWWVIRSSRDRTAIGSSLKKKKLSAGIAEVVLGSLLLVPRLLDMIDYEMGPILRFSMRIVIAIGYGAAALWGIVFAYALISHLQSSVDSDNPDMIVTDGR